jgi:hypothetical protein
MPLTCPPRTLCGPPADARCQGWRLLTIPIRCDHLNVVGRRLPTPVETAHRGPAESAESLASEAPAGCLPIGWSYLIWPSYLPVVTSEHQLMHDLLPELAQRDADHAAFTIGARAGQIDIGGVGSCWHDRLLGSSLQIRSELRHSQRIGRVRRGTASRDFAGVAEPSKERIKPINGGVSVVLKQAAVPR